MKRTNLILSLAISIFLISCNGKEKQQQSLSEISKKVKVETTVAKKQLAERKYSYSGIIEPAVSIPMSFQLPGTITQIYVEEGDKVRKGQKLAEIDNTSFQNSYKAAIATQKQAQDAYDRLKTVYDKGSLPEIQWEEIKTKLEQANSVAAISKENLENCTLRAPSNGVVGSRSAEVGENALPGFSVITVVEIKNIYVKISVPENEINKIKEDQNAHVVIQAVGPNVEIATVSKIGVVANPISKTYDVKLAMSNPEYIFKPGMACDVDLEVTDKNQSITIPYQAVLKDLSGKEYVYVIDKEKKKAKKQIVEVDGFENNDVRIAKGLDINDVVVIQGQHKLSDEVEVLYQ